MSRSKLVVLVVLTVITTLPASAIADVTITQWAFTALSAAPTNSPNPTTGVGTATMLGMTNTYNGGNTASGDILNTASTAFPSFSELTWRIRGTSHNGWATAAAGAAQYTQGAEFDASTANYSNIRFSFDWYSTTQGIRDLQVQYNLNINNANGWTNIGGTSPTGTYIATPSDFYNATPNSVPSPSITVDLSSLAGADNNPNLGIRLVSAYDSTGNIASDYASASLGTTGATVIYNNSSGNWRFANITFSGTAVVPEPSSIALFCVGAAGLVAIRRRMV